LIRQTLRYVEECLARADELLNEVATMNLWSTSDDCSDNRRKRKALREADWTVSGARSKVKKTAAGVPAPRPALDGLEKQLDALVAMLEPLPDFITDVMADRDPELEEKVGKARDELAKVRERTQRLLNPK
jgi:hypothetical protein